MFYRNNALLVLVSFGAANLPHLATWFVYWELLRRTTYWCQHQNGRLLKAMSFLVDRNLFVVDKSSDSLARDLAGLWCFKSRWVLQLLDSVDCGIVPRSILYPFEEGLLGIQWFLWVAVSKIPGSCSFGRSSRNGSISRFHVLLSIFFRLVFQSLCVPLKKSAALSRLISGFWWHQLLLMALIWIRTGIVTLGWAIDAW